MRRVGIAELAEVVLAEHRESKRGAYLKVLRLDVLESEGSVGARERLGERVRLEGDALKKLEHANVPRLIDCGCTPDGRPYFATEPIDEALPLSETIAKKGKLELSEVLRIGKAVTAALAAAHAIGLIHRDVKPKNVLLAGARVLLTDFGIAKVVEPAKGAIKPLAAPTAVDEQIGAPRFLSLEQAMNQPVDARTDLYLLGLLLYECLAGRGPFDDMGKGRGAFADHAAFTRPPSITEARPDIPAPLADLVMSLLEKKPAKRPASAKDVMTRLEEIERLTVGAPNDTEVVARPRAVEALQEAGATAPAVSTTLRNVPEPEPRSSPSTVSAAGDRSPTFAPTLAPPRRTISLSVVLISMFAGAALFAILSRVLGF